MILASHPLARTVLQFRRVTPAHVQGGAKGDNLFHAGQAADFFSQGRQIRPGDCPGRQSGVADHFFDAASGQQVAIGDVSQAMATLSFVHVMRGDEHGQSFSGELMNFLPELPARLGVHAGRRFVEHQQLRFVNQTRCQGEALLPTPGKGAGQLTAAGGHPQSLQALFHSGFSLWYTVNLRNEIEVFLNGQVFIKTEPLGHVADVFFDFARIPQDIVAQTKSAARVGREQAAEHPQKRCLAASVRAEETVNLAPPHLHGNVVHHRAVTESLGDALDVNDQIGRVHGEIVWAVFEFRQLKSKNVDEIPIDIRMNAHHRNHNLRTLQPSLILSGFSIESPGLISGTVT